MRSKCCSQSSDAAVCADLLCPLDYEDIEAVMLKKEFNLEILVQGLAHSGGSASDRTPLYQSSRNTLITHVRALVDSLPKPAAVFNPGFWPMSHAESRYTHKLEASFHSDEWRRSLPLLMDAYATFLEEEEFSAESPEEKAIAKDLAKFGLLCLEYVKWMVASDSSTSSNEGREQALHLALRAAAATFRCQAAAAGWFAAQENWPAAVSACLCLHTVFRGLLRVPSSRLPASPALTDLVRSPTSGAQFPDLGENGGCGPDFSSPPAHSASLACLKLAEIFDYVLSRPSDLAARAKDLRGHLEGVTVGLCRMPLLSSYVRVPPEVWKLDCWRVETSGPLRTVFPIPPVELLQEEDLLREYVARASAVGWLNRQQFEELWVSLLGVFGVSSVEEVRGEEEARALAHCSSGVVHALTGIIVQTMYLPVPGQPNISTPLHHSRYIIVISFNSRSLLICLFLYILSFPFQRLPQPVPAVPSRPATDSYPELHPARNGKE